jgi:hypothetical protein
MCDAASSSPRGEAVRAAHLKGSIGMTDSQRDRIRQLIDHDLESALASLYDRDLNGAAFQIKRFARVLREIVDGADGDKDDIASPSQ